MRSLEWVGWIITDLHTTVSPGLLSQGCEDDVIEGLDHSDMGVEAVREEGV